MFNFNAYAHKKHIETAMPGDRHYRHGWINLSCPFCQQPDGNHLGYNIANGYFYCWSCGKHSIKQVIAKLENCSTFTATQIIKEHDTGERIVPKRNKQKERAEICKPPDGLMDIRKNDKTYKYLAGRRYDPDLLITQWKLKKVAPHANFKWKNRIFIPFEMNNSLITYQCRDFTNKKSPSYMTCPKNEAVMDVKETLYGYDQAKQYDGVIVVEGVFDMWRVGAGAVAVCGTSWTTEQMLLLTEWDRRFILFDPNERGADEQADKLCFSLSGFGGETIKINANHLDGDPGDMTDEQVSELRSFTGINKVGW